MLSSYSAYQNDQELYREPDADLPGSEVNILLKLKTAKNIADLLTEEELLKIGRKCKRHYELDLASMKGWLKSYENALKLAKQILEKPSYPWEDAANFIHPLISIACIQLASELYNEIIRDGKVVKAGVIGDDPDNLFFDSARRISDHMSYQLLEESKSWERGTDQLLHMLALSGTVFRKTYYDPICRKNCSDVCLPNEIIINNKITSLEEAQRISHIIYLSNNYIIERQRAGLYRDISINVLQEQTADGDEDVLHKGIEQHCFLDLDGDGYQEPYIVTFHYQTTRVLRIEARYDIEGLHFNSKKQVEYIDPVHYFTAYHCIPSPDGDFLSLGLGSLLAPINEAINTATNLMLDAGTLQNMPSGFLGRGIRIKGGDYRLRPGEWKYLDGSPAVDAKNSIIQIPTGQPSTVLFNLLGLMIESGKQSAFVDDATTGKLPEANTSPTSVLATIEKGAQRYLSIRKRVYLSLKGEFEKWYRLNSLYLPQDVYYRTLNTDRAIKKIDYNLENINIYPLADGSLSTEAQRLFKAQAILAAAQSMPGAVNAQMAMMMYFQGLRIPENQIKNLIIPPPKEPSPEDQKLLAEVEHIKEKTKAMGGEQQLKQAELSLKDQEIERENRRTLSDHQKAQAQTALEDRRITVEERNMELQHSISLMSQEVQKLRAQLEAMKLVLHEKEVDLKLEQLKEKSQHD